LSPFFNCNFHFKGIKRNVLNNVINFNFLSWISNAYIYVWQRSYNAFDSIIYDIRILNAIRIHSKRATKKMILFFLFGWFFVFTRLRICGPKCQQNVQENFHVKKHVLYIKAYVFIFYSFGFLPKYLCIMTYAYEKSPPPWKWS